MKKEVVKLFDILMAEADRMTEAGETPKTTWDIFTSLVSGKYDPLILVLKADLNILKLIVEGNSLYSASKILGLSSKDIADVCLMWGFTPLSETLDLNPMSVYADGIHPDAFIVLYNLLTPMPITKETAKQVLLNIEHLRDIALFLEEYDNGES